MPDENKCEFIHRVVNGKSRKLHLRYVRDRDSYPESLTSGVCILTENRQTGHGGSRVVHVFSNERNESIGEILGRYERLDPRDEFSMNLAGSFQLKEQAPEYFRENFKYLVVSVPDYGERKRLEEGIRATVYSCPACKAKNDWPGANLDLKKLWVENGISIPDWTKKDWNIFGGRVAASKSGAPDQKTIYNYL